MSMPTAILSHPTLTVSDRCDRCGAQAYVRALLQSGGLLLFCAHHGREHMPKLHAHRAIIEDQSDSLQEEDRLVGQA